MPFRLCLRDQAMWFVSRPYRHCGWRDLGRHRAEARGDKLSPQMTSCRLQPADMPAAVGRRWATVAFRHERSMKRSGAEGRDPGRITEPDDPAHGSDQRSWTSSRIGRRRSDRSAWLNQIRHSGRPSTIGASTGGGAGEIGRPAARPNDFPSSSADQRAVMVATIANRPSARPSRRPSRRFDDAPQVRPAGASVASRPFALVR